MKESFEKVDISEIPQKPVKKKQSKRTIPWKLIGIPVIICIVIVAAIGIALLPLRGVLDKGQVLAARGKELAAAVKTQNLDEAKLKLAETRRALDDLEKEYSKVKPMKFIPFLGAYIRDGEHFIAAGFAGLSAGDKAIEALEPNADILGLKGTSSFVAGTADDRIQTAVKTMNALLPKVNEMAVHIDTLRKEIDQVDPNRYPKSFRGVQVRDQMVLGKKTIEEAANLFVNAQPLLMNLPKMLGEPTEQRYLVLFQNDKELRATGGFLTAYAQFRFSHGKAILEKSDDIYKMDDAKSTTFPAPREILTFHKGVYNLHIRDSNLSPDFKTSMQQFEEMYDTVKGKEVINGIIAMDTYVVVEALRILGPITIGGREFSAEIDPRCDCPKAVYELEDYSTRPVGYIRTDRKDIIGTLMQTMLQQALGVSPSKYWGQLFQMLIEQINQKHVLAYFKDPEMQKAAESFNLAGRIMTAEETAAVLKYKEGAGWDYLHINNSNMAGAKSNMFVSEEFTKDTTVQSDGNITTKLTVQYNNPYKGSDCGLESGGLCLNAPLRNWVRVYAPKGSKLVESKGIISPKDGNAVQMEAYDSLEKTVFEGFLIVNPLGTARFDLTYTSPVKSPDGKYRLLWQKQPGTGEQAYSIKLNGKEKAKSILKTDTEVEL